MGSACSELQQDRRGFSFHFLSNAAIVWPFGRTAGWKYVFAFNNLIGQNKLRAVPDSWLTQTTSESNWETQYLICIDPMAVQRAHLFKNMFDD